jgi:4-hydroxy-tetrahydrodipicolinate synthase
MKPGVYAAAITPMYPDGSPDLVSFAKLFGWLEACGCTGVVVAGTNGEGPSLSAPAKRDLLKAAMRFRGTLDVVLGIATPSLDEARWLAKCAADADADALLVMPPFYFRGASERGILDWFERFATDCQLPILVYNFPKMTGITFSEESLQRLGALPNVVGAKDSSGEADNLTMYKRAMPKHRLYVGDETLLISALEQGWSGTISGVANVLARWLSQIVHDWNRADASKDPASRESVRAKFELVLPLIQSLRACPQPATHKAILTELGILSSAYVLPPLVAAREERAQELLHEIEDRVGSPLLASRPVAPGPMAAP